jgi:hypothetical protein
MYERETVLIIDTIIQRIPKSVSDSIAVKDILAADIPHSIKTFLRADVEAILIEELQRRRKTSRFNFDHHEIRSLQDQINSILVLNYTFDKKELLSRVDDAVHLMINFLIRPQWTLTNMIFEKEQTISTDALVTLLRYFGPYEYLREIITQYLMERKITSVTKEDFKSLLWKVDGGYVRRKSGDELAKVMSPMCDFFDFPNRTYANPILIKAIIKYFEDKGLVMALPRLEGEIAHGKTELSRRELSELLEDIRRTHGSFQVEKVEIEQKEIIERSTENYPASDENQIPSVPRLNLASSINESDKKKFIRKIFQNDENIYDSALRSLSEMTSWKQASKFIDEIYIKHDIDPYSSEATRFIEIMFEQYHPKSK